MVLIAVSLTTRYNYIKYTFLYYKSLLKGIFYKRPPSLQINFAFKYTRNIAFIPVQREEFHLDVIEIVPLFNIIIIRRFETPV